MHACSGTLTVRSGNNTQSPEQQSPAGCQRLLGSKMCCGRAPNRPQKHMNAKHLVVKGSLTPSFEDLTPEALDPHASKASIDPNFNRENRGNRRLLQLTHALCGLGAFRSPCGGHPTARYPLAKNASHTVHAQ